MTEVTDEARKELDDMNCALGLCGYAQIPVTNTVLRALDRHHNRTPPDPMVAKAERLLRAYGDQAFTGEGRFVDFVAQLHKEFPDG